MRIFIDTDIGSDVDDSLAVAYALKHLDVAGITTVHGVPVKRAKIVNRLLASLGISLPVYAGLEKPLVAKEIFVYGHEGNGILDGSEAEPWHGAPEFLSDAVNDGDIIFCIAPLTNIATALAQDKSLKRRIGALYVQAGVLEDKGLYVPNKEKHNVKVDPEAANAVFASGIQLNILTTEIAKQAWLTLEELDKLPKGQPFDYIRQNARDYLKVRSQDKAFIYDPLTVMMFLHPEYFTTAKKGNVTITTGVDAERAKKELLSTLMQKMQ